jgi:hypothetical protein
MRDLTKRNLTRQQRDRGTGVGEDAGFNMAVIPPFRLAWTGRGREKRKHPVSNDVGTAHVHHSNGGEPRLALTAGGSTSAQVHTVLVFPPRASRDEWWGAEKPRPMQFCTACGWPEACLSSLSSFHFTLNVLDAAVSFFESADPSTALTSILAWGCLYLVGCVNTEYTIRTALSTGRTCIQYRRAPSYLLGLREDLLCGMTSSKQPHVTGSDRPARWAHLDGVPPTNVHIRLHCCSRCTPRLNNVCMLRGKSCL